MKKNTTTPTTTPEQNTTPTTEPATTNTTNKGTEEKKMKGTEKKTTTPRKNNTPDNIEKKTEEKKMNTTEKNTATAPATEKKNTLPENIEQAEKTLRGDMLALQNLLNTPAGDGEKFATLTARVNEKRAVVGKDLSALNHLLALRYYKGTPLFDIIKNGDKVPARVIDEQVKGNKYTLTLKKTAVYPTLSGMKTAGVLDDEVIVRVDTLRRITAFVKSNNTATEFLTGDTENKKNLPTEKVSAMIENIGTPSKNKARALLTRVFSDLTGEVYKKEVLPRLYDEFEGYITKRSGVWGVRNMVSKATACDMVLEFAWMYFTGKTTFQYKGE